MEVEVAHLLNHSACDRQIASWPRMSSRHRRQRPDSKRHLQRLHMFERQGSTLELSTFDPRLDDIEMVIGRAIGLEFKSFLFLLNPDNVLVLDSSCKSFLSSACPLTGQGVLLCVRCPMLDDCLVSVLWLVDLLRQSCPERYCKCLSGFRKHCMLLMVN